MTPRTRQAAIEKLQAFADGEISEHTSMGICWHVDTFLKKYHNELELPIHTLVYNITNKSYPFKSENLEEQENKWNVEYKSPRRLFCGFLACWLAEGMESDEYWYTSI